MNDTTTYCMYCDNEIEEGITISVNHKGHERILGNCCITCYDKRIRKGEYYDKRIKKV